VVIVCQIENASWSSSRSKTFVLSHPDDLDAGNIYKDLRFPQEVYDNISEYYDEKGYKLVH
jgi:hypothetical protein